MVTKPCVRPTTVWRGQRSLNRGNLVILFVICGNTNLRLMEFRWLSSPPKEKNLVTQIPPHTSAFLHSCRLWLVPEPLTPLLLQEYPRSWDFKHQKIPALWTPCLLLFLNAVNYTKLSQAWQEWGSRRGLVGGSIGSSSGAVSRLLLTHQFGVIGNKVCRDIVTPIVWSKSLERYSERKFKFAWPAWLFEVLNLCLVFDILASVATR